MSPVTSSVDSGFGDGSSVDGTVVSDGTDHSSSSSQAATATAPEDESSRIQSVLQSVFKTRFVKILKYRVWDSEKLKWYHSKKSMTIASLWMVSQSLHNSFWPSELGIAQFNQITVYDSNVIWYSRLCCTVLLEYIMNHQK